ncbi:protein-L-isoaspartate(D-aspartate) O-methyltransferase [Pseudoalteromonas phenolica]|uniref:Protein-L-isoaspartate O-methyltransferase n=1 Tax=Pseudoalteromonas phenolica TaxID=161398 RepID=A0A0S2K600_9GAMM|nr:protein-L-isoaspartate(D-aspartate) O-methyltransferase [Pseudoalteromonas phenolica]ALO43362.1 Protein-L-isoaspartate O-methyltransferase [Pseudoalteromonas phenolica]MBE0355480.1 protein-L-isoaspartate(D-aspartate) O-methyltransferase [Pseudoalteromonas phenolica O-BC30]RXF00667.1 protein-L-isoaspartate(D-aspartate) O-methyltransferase [Pseudoalteromonas phenolica O-BC30]TMO54019.1 protein-L-isoaspartate(D-aspartate) O-methyltransferase [Pseudoalteromonas phenolica]
MLGNYTRSADALVEQLKASGVQDKKVLQVIKDTPRHLFIDDVLKHKAYENTALPIGNGQTISQPFIVAKMTEILRQVGVKGKVLEIGTGSGYQSAVLAQVFEQVFSVERIKSLQWQAKRRLHQLDLYNVSMKHGDGWQGWQTKGPFSGIIVTAAAKTVPQALLEQLENDGALLVPIGEEEQVLTLVVRKGEQFVEHKMAPVRFVPLIAGEISL